MNLLQCIVFSRMRRPLFYALGILLSIASHAQLAKKKVLSGALEINLPLTFKLMDEKALATKYPAGNKPSEVYTNDEVTVNIAFKKTDQPLVEQTVFEVGKRLQQQMMTSGKVQLVQSDTLTSNNKNVFVFSFYSNAIDTKIYNLMFIFALRGKMVLGSFNCALALQKQWQQIGKEMISSIKEL